MAKGRNSKKKFLTSCVLSDHDWSCASNVSIDPEQVYVYESSSDFRFTVDVSVDLGEIAIPPSLAFVPRVPDGTG